MQTIKFVNLNISKHKWFLWILAAIITIGSAVYQRMTGPTYPMRGKIHVAEEEISFKFLRTETVGNDLPIEIKVNDKSSIGYVQYRRYKSNDEWQQILMERKDSILTAQLPSQPPAGKLTYYVFLQMDQERVSLTGNEPVIARYKGDVPAVILLPHVLLMFLAMLISNRTAFEALDQGGIADKYMLWTIGFFFLGGFILGPLVQKHAFGEFWTGVPFGYDLTDNKTLIAMMGWLLAWIKNRNDKEGRGWIFFAAILMLAVYLILHSVLGSELDYTKME